MTFRTSIKIACSCRLPGLAKQAASVFVLLYQAVSICLVLGSCDFPDEPQDRLQLPPLSLSLSLSLPVLAKPAASVFVLLY